MKKIPFYWKILNPCLWILSIWFGKNELTKLDYQLCFFNIPFIIYNIRYMHTFIGVQIIEEIHFIHDVYKQYQNKNATNLISK